MDMNVNNALAIKIICVNGCVRDKLLHHVEIWWKISTKTSHKVAVTRTVRLRVSFVKSSSSLRLPFPAFPSPFLPSLSKNHLKSDNLFANCSTLQTSPSGSYCFPAGEPLVHFPVYSIKKLKVNTEHSDDIKYLVKSALRG